MKKKLVSMLLAVSMLAALLMGCGGSEEEVDNSGAANQEADADAGADAEADADAGEEEELGEPDEIVIALMCLAPIDEAVSEHVEEKLNEMMLEKINVIADIQWYDAATYGTTVPMMLTSGEQLDVIMSTPVPGAGYQSYMAQNQLMDITEYIEEYGQDIKAVMGTYLDATSKEGSIYGVGNMTCLYGGAKIYMSKTVLDELGLTEQAEKIANWADYKAVLEQVVAQTDLNGVINCDAEGTTVSPQPYMIADFATAYPVDTLGDSYQYVYADPETDQVKCYFDNPDWLASIKVAKEFYDAGLIYKDAATAQEYADTLIKNGVGFSEVKSGEFGGDGAFVAAIGQDVLVVDIVDTTVTTYAFQKFGFGVPVTSEYPEAAVKFINLLYGDQEFVDTLTWGVEGVDWVKNADGMGTYPEGVAPESAYHTMDFLYGNRLLITPWEGDAVDIRDQQKAANEQVAPSKYLGFAVDTSEVANTIAACKTVVDQYKPQLSSGSVEDVDATYAEFIDALYAAGMQDILDAYQAQLDAWLAAQ